MKRKVKIWKLGIAIVIAVAAITQLCYWAVALSARSRVYDSVAEIPFNEVGMMLGTGPTTVTGDVNMFSLTASTRLRSCTRRGR